MLMNDGVTAICCLYYWFAPDLTSVLPAKLPILLTVKLQLGGVSGYVTTL
jgi:hypothetical protein